MPRSTLLWHGVINAYVRVLTCVHAYEGNENIGERRNHKGRMRDDQALGTLHVTVDSLGRILQVALVGVEDVGLLGVVLLHHEQRHVVNRGLHVCLLCIH